MLAAQPGTAGIAAIASAFLAACLFVFVRTILNTLYSENL